ncbi:MAG: universal stress protein [Vulcanimicrobiota bacterium]
MFKNILVPLGDSKNTAQALTNACELAKIFQSKVHCLYVADMQKISSAFVAVQQLSDGVGLDIMYNPAAVELSEKEVRMEEEFAESYFEQWTKKYPELEIEMEKTEGIVVDEILEREKDFDLLVMGKTLYDEEDITDKVSHILKQVVHKSILPVLVSTMENQIGANLLACYDGKKPALKALNVACEVAKKFDAPLYILTTDKIEKNARQINNEAVIVARNDGVKEVLPLVEPFNIVGAVQGTIDRNNINFLFMGAYGDNPIKDFILGSTTDFILNGTGCPTLLYR